MTKVEDKLFKKLIELQEEEQTILKQLSIYERKIFSFKNKFYKIVSRDNKLFLVEIQTNK